VAAPRILIAGPAWVGDMVMAQGLFRTLRAQHPDAAIDVVAPAWSGPILARMPEVRRHVVLPAGHDQLAFGARRRLGRALRAERYDRAIVMPRSWKSALVPWFSRARVRTGYRGEWRYGLLNDIRPLDRAVLRQTVQRYVALGLPRDAPLPPPVPRPQLRVDADHQARLLAELGLASGRPAIALLPGAEYGPAKQWPPEHYAELARRLGAGGHAVWVLGSAKEAALGAAIAAQSGGAATSLCGRTQLADAVDLLAHCRAVVTNDSGLMHIAAAVGTAVVALYGSSSPDYTPPLTDRARVLRLGLACSPCYARTCRYGHYDCLRGISVDAVEAALAAAVAGPSPS
jgi:heptosyltransferase-2